jgi:hypothetical protein
MTGTVVDAETGEPIEGAVVLVEWTITKGVPGMTYHKVYKIIEVETDKRGKFKVRGVFNPLVNPPDVVIYKAGYVAWRNDFIFPEWKKRTDFKFKKEVTFKLERFKEYYSKEQHHYFIGTGIIGDNFERTPKFSAIRRKTSREAQQEIEEKK